MRALGPVFSPGLPVPAVWRALRPAREDVGRSTGDYPPLRAHGGLRWERSIPARLPLGAGRHRRDKESGEVSKRHLPVLGEGQESGLRMSRLSALRVAGLLRRAAPRVAWRRGHP
jgi:hypothetical protein